MSVLMQPARTPQGREYMTLRSTGTITLPEAEQLVTSMSPGGEHHQKRVLGYANSETSYTPDARRRLMALSRQYSALAVVVESAIARAGINLMMRIAGDFGNVRLFTSEAAALAWFDDSE